MADLPSTFVKVTDVEVTQDASVTENFLVKLGQNDNYLKDNLDAEITNRTNGDGNLQGQINAIEAELNSKIISVPKLIASGSSGPVFELVQAQIVTSIYFHKSFPTGKTFLEVKLFNDDGDDMYGEFQFDLGVDPTTWTTSSWAWDAQNDLVLWYLFAPVTISL